MKQRSSWLSLVTFCATAAFVAALALAMVFVTVTAAAAFNPDDAGGLQEFSGVISDSHCVGRHVMKDKSPEECTRLCVQQGAKYVLVDGEKVYTLDGKSADFTAFSGERVTVSGVLDGTTIKVTGVKAIRSMPPSQ